MSSTTQLSPEFDIDKSEVRHVIIVLTQMFIFATVTVLFRFIAQSKRNSSFSLDDWLILGASVLAAGPLWTFVESAWTQELGRHSEFNGQNAQISFRKKLYSGELVSILAIVLTKLSILALYWRIFGGFRTMKMPLQVTAGVVIYGSIGFFIPSVLQCNPIHKAWDTVTEGTCINIHVLLLANATFNIVTYFGLLVLPELSWINSHNSSTTRAIGRACL